MRNPELVDVAALLLRLSLAAMFFAHAWLKIRVFTVPGTVKYFESLGVPGFLAYLTIAAEVLGGLLLLLGIGSRWVALALVPLIAGTRRHQSGATAKRARLDRRAFAPSPASPTR